MEKLILIIVSLITITVSGQPKAMVLNGKIVRTRMTSIFKRPNGETVYGGYNRLSDSIHYKDGWRDVIRPTFDPDTQELGVEYHDTINDVVTWRVSSRPLPVIEDIRKQKHEQVYSLVLEFSELVTAAENLYGNQMPQKLVDLINTVRSMRTQANFDIDTLSTPKEAVKFKIYNPTVEAYLDSIKSFLQ